LNDGSLKTIWLRTAAVAAAVVLVDQITKSWAEDRLADDVIHVFGTLQFALAYNRGVAFGLGAGVAPVLVSLAVVGAVLALIGKQIRLNSMSSIAVGLLLGGAIGNVADRLFRGHGGAVVDFIDLQWWPVFNVADAAIVVGALILVLFGSKRERV